MIRSLKEKIFILAALTSTAFGVIVLATLLVYTFILAFPWLDWQFLTSSPSRFADKAGIYPPLIGSVMSITLTALFVIPIGIGAGIYLEEYAKKNIVTKILEINISNLAAVPSIVYGLLGLGLFVLTLGLKPGIVLVGSLTLMLLILPVVIVATQEALRAVPFSLREASLAVGASKWQTIKNVVLPSAMPGIMTGIILALSRAIGETAPLIMVGVATATFTAPKDILSAYSALPMLIFMWTDMPSSSFIYGLAPAAIIVLITIMLSMNAFAIYMRNTYSRRLK